MLRLAHYHFRRFERVVRGRIRLNPNGRLARLARSEILDFERGHLARGLAIGMFWAFLPIPFQMAPAALFCFFARGNLPLALVAVWISNPLTYPAIFYFEYRVGAFVLSDSTMLEAAKTALESGGGILDFFSALVTPDAIKVFLAGALTTSCVAMIFGYGAGLLMHRAVRRRIEIKAQKRARRDANAH